MRKFVTMLVLLVAGTLLSSCASNYESFQASNPGLGNYVKACPANDPNGSRSTCGLGAHQTLSIAKEAALEVCHEYNYNCVVVIVNNSYVSGYSSTSGSGSTSYGSSYSGSSSTQIPQLYYDAQTGGMRQCLHDPGASGKCLAFAPSLKQYYTDTLFYNPKTGAMQPCLHATALGQCQSFGVFNHSSVSKGQLFYDPKNKKMTTCLHVTVSGNCAHYELVPNSYAKNYGGFRMTPDSSNPYYKRVPRSNQSLIDSGMRMLGGGCTLGINC